MTAMRVLLVLPWACWSAHAAEVSIETCVSTFFTEKSTQTDVGGFSSTCYTMDGSVFREENKFFSSSSDREIRDFALGVCNTSGATQQYVTTHELKYTINKTADADERVDVRVHYDPISEVVTEGSGTVTSQSEFELENNVCVDFIPFLLSTSFQAYSGLDSSLLVDQQDLNGIFWEPDVPGHGFDFKLHELGFTVFYYGHTADGQRLWLISEPYSEPVRFYENLSMQMYEVAQGTFGAPAPGAETVWGTMTLTLVDCDHGNVVLDGVDGRISINLERLVGLPISSCP